MPKIKIAESFRQLAKIAEEFKKNLKIRYMF